MLNVVYRSCGGENRKHRPEYYSKYACLVSLLRALSGLEGRYRLTFLNDGAIPADLLRLMEGAGTVVPCEGLGSQGSMRLAMYLGLGSAEADREIVWFAEDDYLYLPSAFSDLLAAEQVFPEADYFGLYASFGSTSASGAPHAPWAHVPRQALQAGRTATIGGRSWSRALSTTSTFGARAGTLRVDQRMMEAVMRTGGAWDHTTCLMYQGYMPSSLGLLGMHYAPNRRFRSQVRSVIVRGGLNLWQLQRMMLGRRTHVLVAPYPAICTHLECDQLAPGTDWSAVAADSRAWGAEREALA